MSRRVRWRVCVSIGSLLLASIVVAACTGSAATPGPREFPLVPCPVDGPGARTAPPGSALVSPGTIVFGWEQLRNVSGGDTECGAQAVVGAKSVFSIASLGGEDRIPWAATLARSGNPSTPDPVMPIMTLVREDVGGPVVVATQVGEPAEMYRMLGAYGHEAKAGSYLMRIVSGSGELLAEGRFEVVP